MYLYRGMSNLELISWQRPEYRDSLYLPERKDFTASPQEAANFAGDHVLLGVPLVLEVSYDANFFRETMDSGEPRGHWYETALAFLLEQLPFDVLDLRESYNRNY